MTIHRPSTAYSNTEEWLNSISHGLGLIVATIGLILMLLKAETPLSIAASSIYGATLILMFLSSTIYHGVTNPKAKSMLKLFDHSAIYLLIAGTYTPLTLVAIGGTLGVSVTILVWLLALAGVAFKLLAKHRFPKISVMTYLIMGWIAVALIYPLYNAIAPAGLWLIVAGGITYSIGVLFYVAKNTPFTHAIWHLFVIGGCCCHYFSIYYYVL
jgi:hemolysin III